MRHCGGAESCRYENIKLCQSGDAKSCVSTDVSRWRRICGVVVFFSLVSIMHYLLFSRHYSSLWKRCFISGGGSAVETQDFASFVAPQEFCNGSDFFLNPLNFDVSFVVLLLSEFR